MIVLEPTNLSAPVHGALAESVGLRLELEQRAWLRAGRDIVGRRVSVNVAKNRFGPPGRETEIVTQRPSVSLRHPVAWRLLSNQRSVAAGQSGSICRHPIISSRLRSPSSHNS